MKLASYQNILKLEPSLSNKVLIKSCSSGKIFTISSNILSKNNHICLFDNESGLIVEKHRALLEMHYFILNKENKNEH